MKEEKETNREAGSDRQDGQPWVAPDLTVLSAGATAGGPNINSEAFSYHPS